ncbi:MAG: 50S ribosomal protein L6 [Pseudomonadota bacterium]
MESRIVKNPIEIAKDVQINITDRTVVIKGPKGQLTHQLHPFIDLVQEENSLRVVAKEIDTKSRSLLKKRSTVNALGGTTGALIKNCIKGVTEGFSKKLKLVGVGYRAQLQGKKLVLALGYSHPIEYALPESIDAAVPSPTEIMITGMDKQLVGQVAAEIRAFRSPEPYKGKGVRYADEVVQLKETKKK